MYYNNINELKFSIDEGAVLKLDVQVNDILRVKKQHPCGGTDFLVLRVGMDFKIKCIKCNHEVMVPRFKIEKNIKKIIREAER